MFAKFSGPGPQIGLLLPNKTEPAMSTEMLQLTLNATASSKAILVYFFSDHCAPCQSLRPKVDALLKEEFPQMKLMLIDSEKHPEVTAHFQVFANPTLLVYFEGHEHYRLSKYVSIPQLETAVERPYSLLFDN